MDLGQQPGLQVAHVGLVDHRAHLHFTEIRHYEESDPARDVRGGRLDHGALLHVLLDDRAVHGGTDANVGHLQFGQIEVRLSAYQRGLSIREGKRRVLELGLRDHLGLEKAPLAVQLGLRDVELSTGHREVGFGLIEAVLDVARIDLGEERTALDHITDIGVQGEKLSTRFRFHLDPAYGFDRAGRLRTKEKISSRDFRGDQGRPGVFGGLARLASRERQRSQHQHRSGPNQQLHTALSAGSLRKSLSMIPSFRWT